ncbi:MAG: aldo/keto reductase, partial [SAR202 cluster bacterium]|nr:aldo/keto reductase [SAR202 cluster bacterium]
DVLEREGSIQALEDLKREGKVRFIGSSSILPNFADHIAMGVFDVFQVPYSALQPEHEEAIAEAARAGAGIVVRGGVARGEPGEGQGTDRVWDLWRKANLDELLDDESPTEFMLRFTIASPDMHTTIVGTLSSRHLQENVAAALKGPLPPSIYREAGRRLAAARSVPS